MERHLPSGALMLTLSRGRVAVSSNSWASAAAEGFKVSPARETGTGSVGLTDGMLAGAPVVDALAEVLPVLTATSEELRLVEDATVVSVAVVEPPFVAEALLELSEEANVLLSAIMTLLLETVPGEIEVVAELSSSTDVVLLLTLTMLLLVTEVELGEDTDVSLFAAVVLLLVTKVVLDLIKSDSIDVVPLTTALLLLPVVKAELAEEADELFSSMIALLPLIGVVVEL